MTKKSTNRISNSAKRTNLNTLSTALVSSDGCMTRCCLCITTPLAGRVYALKSRPIRLQRSRVTNACLPSLRLATTRAPVHHQKNCCLSISWNPHSSNTPTARSLQAPSQLSAPSRTPRPGRTLSPPLRSAVALRRPPVCSRVRAWSVRSFLIREWYPLDINQDNGTFFVYTPSVFQYLQGSFVFNSKRWRRFFLEIMKANGQKIRKFTKALRCYTQPLMRF